MGKEFKLVNRVKYLLFFVFLVIFIAIIRLSFSSVGTGDVASWQRYVKVSVSAPLKELIPLCLNYECPFPDYNGTYPPGYILLFLTFSNILPVQIFGTFATVKLIIFIFYTITFLTLISINILINRFTHSCIESLISTLMLFGTVISLTLNSLWLGYTDIFIYPFILLSLFLLARHKIFFSGIFYSVAVLIKWQPLIIVPFLFIYLIKLGRTKLLKVKSVLLFCIGAAIPVLLLVPLNPKIISAIYLALTQGAYNDTVFSSALNIQWITTYILHILFPNIFGPIKDGLNTYIVVTDNLPGLLNIPKLFFWSAYGLIVWKFIKKKTESKLFFLHFLITAIAGYFTYFMFSTGVHENHLSVALLFSLILYLLYPNKKSRLLLLFIDMVHFLNMFIFYGFNGSVVIRSVGSVDLSIPLSVFSIIGYIFLLRRYNSVFKISP